MQMGNCTVSQLALIKLQFSEDHGSLMFMNVSRVFLDTPASSKRQPVSNQPAETLQYLNCFLSHSGFNDPLRLRDESVSTYIYIYIARMSHSGATWGGNWDGGSETRSERLPGLIWQFLEFFWRTFPQEQSHGFSKVVE